MDVKKFEVIRTGKGFQVVLFDEEFYRDQPGNIRKRRVITRKYDTFDNPVEAQIVADKWNNEDGLY